MDRKALARFGSSRAEADARHQAKVARIARELRMRKGGAPVSLQKKTPRHQVPKRNDARYRDEKIFIGDLDEVLHLDPESRTCVAEPGVTFHQLVKTTLPHGLVPMVVPEHKTITVGGAVAGCSIESTSFRYGGFHDTCREYEVITATGEVLTCTPENEHHLVFQMMHGSFGTLGILSKLTFELVPAEPFVHVRYEHCRKRGDFEAALWRRVEAGDVDFVDGIVHARDHCVLAAGRFARRTPYVSCYTWMRAYPESTAVREEDYLATVDYLFRYDRGVTQVRPKSRLGRFLFGRWVHSHNLLRAAEKLHRFLPAKRPRVIVDVFVPFSRASEFLDWYEREIDFYPLWVVPYRRVRDYEWLRPEWYAGVDDALFLDLAIYGLAQPRGRNYYQEIEDELLRVNGVKTLISYNYYDEETFWSIWNKENYDAVKRLTDPHNVFRDLYAKTCRAALGLEKRTMH